jgi:peptidoglycan/xylan/chitin deacetylase (PgdA/CDA1 family)
MSKHHKTALVFLLLLLILTVLSFYTAIGIGYFVLVVLVWFGISMYGSAFIDSGFHAKTYCSNPSETTNKIAITFDDGPTPITLQILEILEKYQTKATFFCIGKNIEKHPEILRQTFDAGHLIGNHSYGHSPLIDFYNKVQFIAELEKTDRLIQKTTGKKPKFFRPPYGVTTPSMGRALKVTKHKVIGWNIRSLDGGLKSEDVIFNRIKSRISPGGILLLHDTGEHSAKVLERLLVTLRQKNYEVVSLEQLLNLQAYEN